MYNLVITMAANAADNATGSTNNYAQMATTYRIISIVMFCLAGACLAFGIFCFFIFKIPKIIGDLSGRTARKSIEQMREENEKSGNKSYRPHPVAQGRGTVTEQIKQSGRSKKSNAQKQPSAKISGASQPDNTGSGATDVLDDLNATQPLNYSKGATEVLNEGTQILSANEIRAAINQSKTQLNMIQNIVFIHTEEII